MKQANQPASDQLVVQRRRLLGAAGTTGALAAAATVLATREAGVGAAAGVAGQAAPEQPGGYQLTAHVMRYYETTRV